MRQHLAIVCTSVDDENTAKQLAEALVREKLAACVQVSARGTSYYRWQGKPEQADEYYLSIKTTAAGKASVMGWLDRHHPYDLPEIICLDGEASSAYAAWVAEDTEAGL
ncbi:MAG: divalent-cation tolerance protein CutA [Mariprofundaceae bacterium]|nr:divalent-cation tolerance protein CutA [Mariprofundaceae bacterium]